jgi:sugar phosphate isomerase/epimerase
MGEGTVDWREMIRLLLARGYTGPLSFHSEFESPSQRYLLEQTQRDIQYLRNVEKEVRAGECAARI